LLVEVPQVLQVQVVQVVQNLLVAAVVLVLLEFQYQALVVYRDPVMAVQEYFQRLVVLLYSMLVVEAVVVHM
jgi:hypothetical protein